MRKQAGKKIGSGCLAVIGLLLAVWGPASPAVVQTPKRNVLLIIADDFGVDQLQRYVDHFNNDDMRADNDLLDDSGADLTPATTYFIDRLADAGVSFENVWSSPVCSASRAGILTGQYSVHNQIYDVVPPNAALSTSTTTIAETLASAGFKSALFGKWHLGSPIPTTHGFDLFKGFEDGVLSSYFTWDKTSSLHTYDPVLKKWLIGYDKYTTDGTNNSYATFVNVDDASDWINSQSQNWLAIVAFNAPHLLTDNTLDGQDPPTMRLCSGSGSKDDESKIYPAVINCMDAQIGVLLARVRDKLSNTTIIFVGDNGTDSTMTSSPAFRKPHGKSSVYEGGVAVPLIIADGNVYVSGVTGSGSGKVVNPGRFSGALVQTIDLFDTIAGIAASGGYTDDSESLIPVLNGTTDVVRTHSYTEIIDHKIGETQVAARNSSHKLVHLNDGSCELYNLNSDRWEQSAPLTVSKVVGPGGAVSLNYSIQQLLLGKMNSTLGLSLTCN